MAKVKSSRGKSVHEVDPPEVRLDGTLSFMQRLWALYHELQSASKLMERSIGLTGPQRIVLRVVQKNPNVSAGTLARALRLHPSTLTGILRRLEEQGLLLRRKDKADGRRALLATTARGLGVLASKGGTVEAAVAKLLKRWPPGAVASTNDTLDELVRCIGATMSPR